jgi:hypothetical protein
VSWPQQRNSEARILTLVLGQRRWNLVEHLLCSQTNVIEWLSNEFVASGKYLSKLIRFFQNDDNDDDKDGD